MTDKLMSHSAASASTVTLSQHDGKQRYFPAHCIDIGPKFVDVDPEIAKKIKGKTTFQTYRTICRSYTDHRAKAFERHLFAEESQSWLKVSHDSVSKAWLRISGKFMYFPEPATVDEALVRVKDYIEGQNTKPPQYYNMGFGLTAIDIIKDYHSEHDYSSDPGDCDACLLSWNALTRVSTIYADLYQEYELQMRENANQIMLTKVNICDTWNCETDGRIPPLMKCRSALTQAALSASAGLDFLLQALESDTGLHSTPSRPSSPARMPSLRYSGGSRRNGTTSSLRQQLNM